MAHVRLLKDRNGKHTTLCDVGREIVRVIRGIPYVKKWFPGLITGGSRQRKISFTRLDTGLLVTVSGHGKRQHIRVITDQRNLVEQAISEEWGF